MNKQERIKIFQSMNISQRKALILKKMKALGIEVGSGISNNNMILKKFMN